MIKRHLKDTLFRSPVLRSAHQSLRGRLQTRQAAKNLAWHLKLAAQRRLSAPQSVDDLQDRLRQRIDTSRRGRAAKRQGDLHIFVAYQVKNWESVIPKSLEPFGKVSSFDFLANGYDESRTDWRSLRPTMNAEMLAAFKAANASRPIDAVVGYLSGHNTDPRVLESMADAGAVIFNFCWDDKLNYPGREIEGVYDTTAGIASAVDLNLTNAPDSVIKYFVHGGLAMFWPEAAFPETHRPIDVEFAYDVSFVGARYGRRPALIDQLKSAGIVVECFGRGWPNGPIEASEMMKLFSSSRINLGFSTIGYSKKLMCLKGRDFEIPMGGNLYLTQHNPELALVYEVGKEILTYHSAEDCAQKIEHFLAHPAEAQKIRTAGRERCLRDHTYFTRWQQIFQLAGILQ